MKALMAAQSGKFAYSSLLGSRAENVYTWFLKSLDLPGDVAECGVYLGETSRELVRYLDSEGISKIVHMFDSFEGFPDVVTSEEKDLSTWPELKTGQYACSFETVRQQMNGLHRFKIHQGTFSETFKQFSKRLCFIHADGDLYESTVATIHLANRVLTTGGHIVFDDYNNPRLPGVKLAVERYLSPQAYEITPSQNTIQCFATKR
jgi:hypothetical protein